MIEIKGWTGKNVSLKDLVFKIPRPPEKHYSFHLADTKGAKNEWSPEDWPPKKIKITIEEDKT